MEISSEKRGSQKKRRGGGIGGCSAWEGANDLPWGRKGLPEEPGLGGDYKDKYKMNFIQDSCHIFSLHFKSTFH